MNISSSNIESAGIDIAIYKPIGSKIYKKKEVKNPMLILLIILVLLLIGALPTWPYSSGWGYYPGGGIGLILVILLILLLLGYIHI
jgi:hypothetical protein